MAVGDQAGGSGPEITGGPFFGRFTTEERRTRFGLKIAWDVVHLAEAVSNNHAGCVCRFECRFITLAEIAEDAQDRRAPACIGTCASVQNMAGRKLGPRFSARGAR